MHIIYFSKIPIFPVNGGENLRAFGLIKILNDFSKNLSVIIPNPNCYNYKDIKDLKHTEFYNHKFSKRHLVFPFYREKKLLKLLIKIHSGNKIDLAFIDYMFYGQYINWFKKRNIKVIYGTHNSQAFLIKQKKFSKWYLNIANQLWYFFVKIHERLFFKNADKIIVVSENDRIYHENFINPNKIEIIPNFLIGNYYNAVTTIQKNKNLIVFCSNFYSFQNKEGLNWFINQVWDDELSSTAELILVGKGSEEIYNDLELNNYPNIKYTGEVPDVKGYISKSKVSILPLLHGSGSRLKCIESMALKTQVVSTSKGAEGISNNNYSIIIEDDPKDFKKKIISVLRGKIDRTNSAYETFKKYYSLHAVNNKLVNIIKKFL